MPKVVVLPTLPSQLGLFFRDIAGQHIPDLLDGLEGYLQNTTKVIEQYPDGEMKNALMAQSATISSLLSTARIKAGAII